MRLMASITLALLSITALRSDDFSLVVFSFAFCELALSAAGLVFSLSTPFNGTTSVSSLTFATTSQLNTTA